MAEGTPATAEDAAPRAAGCAHGSDRKIHHLPQARDHGRTRSVHQPPAADRVDADKASAVAGGRWAKADAGLIPGRQTGFANRRASRASGPFEPDRVPGSDPRLAEFDVDLGRPPAPRATSFAHRAPDVLLRLSGARLAAFNRLKAPPSTDRAARMAGWLAARAEARHGQRPSPRVAGGAPGPHPPSSRSAPPPPGRGGRPCR